MATEPDILRPSRSYEINLRIKGENYSNDITRVRLSSSLATGYQIVSLTINITPQSILLNKLYGQDSIELVIKRLDESEVVSETMVFDLMILNSEFEIPVSDLITTDQQMDRTSFELVTVTRTPFEIMTTMVSAVFGPTPTKTVWTAPKTIKEMIETIIDEQITAPLQLKYDTVNENLDQIRQSCIPPTTLYQAIKYLDRNYGLYNGVPAVFCQYDNTLQIMNLSSRIKKGYTIFVEHLNNQTKQEDIDKATQDKKYFYTYDNLYTNYVGNSKFGVIGQTLKHVVLPSDKLSHVIVQNLQDVCASYGLISDTKDKKPHVNTSVTNRIKYYIDNNGYDISEVFANSKIAKQISDISRLSFSIERNLPIEDLIKIGVCVKIKTLTQEHIDISGKYILFSSDLVWNKQGDWQTVAKLELIRTNKTV